MRLVYLVFARGSLVIPRLCIRNISIYALTKRVTFAQA